MALYSYCRTAGHVGTDHRSERDQRAAELPVCVMAYVVMAYLCQIYSDGLYGCGLCSYGLYSCGLCT